jgi:hypothetical protein
MQQGDLGEFHQERLIVVLEGVLALVVNEKHLTGRFRKREQVTGYHIIWHEVPLKRLVMMAERYPQFSIEILSFRSQKLIDMAAEFLDDAHIPYSLVRYQGYDQFVSMLRYQRDIRAIYDSDPDRLDDYGQLGVAVVRGNDF